MFFCYTLIVLNTKYITGFRDFGKRIVQEGKLYESTEHIDDQERVCEIVNNHEKTNLEPLNTVDDILDISILNFHSKVYVIFKLIRWYLILLLFYFLNRDCDNNCNQKDLLDTNEYINYDIMLVNKSGTSKINPEQKNERYNQIISILYTLALII